jgi:hypothetical protein
MMSFLIHSLEVAIGIFAFVAMWVIYPYSFSLFELYRIAPLIIFFNRFFFSVVAGVAAYFFSISYFEPEVPKKKPEVSAVEKATISPIQQPANTYPSLAVQHKEYEGRVTTNSGRDVPTVSSSSFTAEQLEEAENKVQYHGNDPIVRQRLGLPPKD